MRSWPLADYEISQNADIFEISSSSALAVQVLDSSGYNGSLL